MALMILQSLQPQLITHSLMISDKGMEPTAASQSSSGDSYLMRTLWKDAYQQQYLKAMLSGNDTYFVILVTDSGLVHDMPNKPRELQDTPTIPDICKEQRCKREF